MKHIILTLALLCSLTVSQAQKLENALLWEISGNGLKESSYIFGTIHMTCDATLDDHVKKALDETSLLVLELDMDEPSMMTDMMKGLYMKNKTTLKDLISDEEYSIVSDFVDEQLGMSLEYFSTTKPYFIIASFLPKILDCPIQSLENVLMQVAHEQNEEVLGLETVEEQLKVFDDIPYKDQAQDLVCSAKEKLEKDKASFKKLLSYYDEENIEGMIMLMDEDKTLSTSKYKDKLLDERNKKWISKIGDFATSQPTFFGVGAAHLAGDYGVIKLLRKAGYTVTPSY